jgi:hypothetical protein
MSAASGLPDSAVICIADTGFGIFKCLKRVAEVHRRDAASSSVGKGGVLLAGQQLKRRRGSALIEIMGEKACTQGRKSIHGLTILVRRNGP